MEVEKLPDLSGYYDPEPFPDRPKRLEYSRIILTLFVIAFLMLNWVLHYNTFVAIINSTIAILLFAPLTFPHEELHRVIAERLGYDAEAHILTPYPHNIIREQKIPVEDYFQILLAPIKYMTIPILALIILAQFLSSMIPAWIDATGICLILLFAHLSTCVDDVHQWQYLKANYSLDDIVYMVDDRKDGLWMTFKFFQTGYYQRIEN